MPHTHTISRDRSSRVDSVPSVAEAALVELPFSITSLVLTGFTYQGELFGLFELFCAYWIVGRGVFRQGYPEVGQVRV